MKIGSMVLGKQVGEIYRKWCFGALGLPYGKWGLLDRPGTAEEDHCLARL